LFLFHLFCQLGGKPTGEPTRDDLMQTRLGQRCPTIQAVALSSPAAACHCNALQWLVVAFSAKQKQQLHHQQLTNGSTILFTYTFSVNLDLFNLSIYSIFWINFSE
jgi:hypothetical protein